MFHKKKKESYDIMFIIGLSLAVIAAVGLFIGGGNTSWAVPFGILGIVFIGVAKRKKK